LWNWSRRFDPAEHPGDCGARETKLDRLPPMMVKFLDYVTRRFKASLARLNKAAGAEPPLYAISRFNWSPESAEMRPLFQSASRGWFLVPRGTGLQLMQFNNSTSTKK
jgi:hypothetical protein